MARVTVEDCIDKVDNRFDLVLLASHRARQVSQGALITVDRDNDKNPVVALREIADGTMTPDELREAKVRSMRRYVERDEPEDDDLTLEDAGRQLTAANEDITPENLQKVLSDMVSSEVEHEMNVEGAGDDQEAGEPTEQ